MVRVACSLLVCMLVFGTGCKTKNSDSGEVVVVSAGVSADATRADHEATLRQTVQKQIEIATRTSGVNNAQLLHRTPYWFREYVNYPDGATVLSSVVAETESLTRPYQAEVEVNKVRFATRLHRSRKEAAADSNFLRDTGTEVISFELRNGQWSRTGSMYVANSTEEQVNGVWQPVNEQATIAVQAEDGGGFFSKTWSRIFGR